MPHQIREDCWSLPLVFPRYSFRALCACWLFLQACTLFLLWQSPVFSSSLAFVLLGLALFATVVILAQHHIRSFKAFFSDKNRLTEIRFHNQEWLLQWGKEQPFQAVEILVETRVWAYWVLLHCRVKQDDGKKKPMFLWLPKDAFIVPREGCLNDERFRHLSRLLSFYSLAHQGCD